jgi:DNA replication and repair protein RecF
MLKKLTLINFRNYIDNTFIFNDSLTIITGENGIGKTNIIEAITALSFIKPFRSNKKEVFIHHDNDFSRIIANLLDFEILDIFWGLNTKKSLQLKINNEILSSLNYLKNKKLLVVLFSPEDLNLPFMSPLNRRVLLARILSSLFSEYYDAAVKYKHVLQQRNALLKCFFEKNINKSEFTFWNEELSKHYKILLKHHNYYFEFINIHIKEEYFKISGKNESVQILPKYSCDKSKNFIDILEESFEKDIYTKTTNKGVHRDDYIFYLRGLPVQDSGSRGEIRSLILAFKKCEEKYIFYITQNKPLLLLDDVFSELDHNHQINLLNSLENQQCIITTTELNIKVPENINVSYIKI